MYALKDSYRLGFFVVRMWLGLVITLITILLIQIYIRNQSSSFYTLYDILVYWSVFLSTWGGFS